MAVQDPAEPRRPWRWTGPDSLGVGEGPRENPLLLAEFRRWRSRPLTYSAFAILLGLMLAFTYQLRNGAIGFAPTTKTGIYLHWMVSLVLRPSAIIPALMVWRALYSFRDGPLYEPFRLTWLTPSQFVRGVALIPFLVGLAVMVGYTMIVLRPTVFQRWSFWLTVQGQEKLTWYGFIPEISSIIVEGTANGLLIALITFHLGMRFRVELIGLALAFLACIAVQALHLGAQELIVRRLMQVGNAWPPHWRTAWYSSGNLLVIAAMKSVAIFFLWRMLLRFIRRVENFT